MRIASIILASASSAVLALPALGAGADRGGQPITAIFEDGNYAEASVSFSRPNVTGTDILTNDTGEAAKDYELFGFALKTELSPEWSLSLIFDQPFTADIKFPLEGSGYNTATEGAGVTGRSDAATIIGRYKLGNGLSVHGGVRMLRGFQDFTLRGPLYGPLNGYDVEFKSERGIGVVLGGAYENPELGQRVSLTWGSEIELDHDTEETGIPVLGARNSTTTITTPQTLNLEFRQGLSQTSLVFGSIRWVNWDGYEVRPEGLDLAAGAPLFSYSSDSLTYKLGYGRRFDERWSGAVIAGYDTGFGGLSTSFGLTDGYASLSGALTYTMPDGVKITGGVTYFDAGDTSTGVGGNRIADFSDNSSLGVLILRWDCSAPLRCDPNCACFGSSWLSQTPSVPP